MVTVAANVTEIEQLQVQSPAPVTHQFLTNIVNPPSLLKCKELIKIEDKEIWEKGMCNELG